MKKLSPQCNTQRWPASIATQAWPRVCPGSEISAMPGDTSLSSLAAANPRQFSPSGVCSTILGPCAHRTGRNRNRSPRVGGPHCNERLRCGDVYLSLGEIGYTANVVVVEISDDDVAHVVTAKAKSLNLIDGGFLAVEHRADEASGRSDPPGRVVTVFRSEARVDQHQTVLGLDEQHVAHQPAASERV